MHGEERVGGEVAERLECCVQGSGCFLVEWEVDWLVEGFLSGFHSSPDECPATWCWASLYLGLSRVRGCDSTQLREVACEPLLLSISHMLNHSS